ncbi:F-actin-monooxygenase Mical-like isoform X2 [Chrysoperla carnea]|uniref:F-actin-monooxygenase Mical-like isoform X2 n=1 Tax=Chrysoperla carnea TaxID=189513 RepID=UPI001D07558A|nr:F-actin-monooxygenase Mical-like isoform X2 [Chrysoperla carnea]
MDNVRGNRTGGVGHGKVSPFDEGAALATDVFDHFCAATTLKSILGLHRHMCDLLKLRPTNLPLFYPKLKLKLRSWKAQALWKRLDIRANHKCYGRGKACASTRVLVIGAGPCGLRAAIECQLLGAKVVVIEKRDRLSRNNVLHLWPFVIHDLRALGAKKFFGKFCAGAIDHISIRQLQCILLKVALLLGVEIHEGVGFESLVPPTEIENEKHGWHASVSPEDHPVSHYEFDVLIGADGKRNTLDGFKRKEFRGKLAIAITANFINKHSEAEARVQEISGVAFIFNQKFFKDLYQETGIDLENIVYYKDETHYFVMTAKKHSLIDKGVILQDVPDTAKLLAPENVDREALMKYAREAADFSTNYQMPNLEFAVNHYGQPDVAMFDFTSMYAAENASRVVERNGYRLLMCLVGDSLLEPFWPTGSGCARGFLSSLDACWAVRSWGSGSSNPLEVLAERESVYRLLGQTTPENLQRDYAAYTLCPSTRYPNLNRFLVTPVQVRYLYDTDNTERIEIPIIQDINAPGNEVQKKKRKRDTQVHPDTLLHWIQKQVSAYSLKIENITESFKNGLVLCAIIHRYRPELVDWSSLKPENIVENNQLAFDLLEKELGIPPVMTGEEMAECTTPDKLTMLSYLSQIYETFHGEIPQTIKHLKIDMKELKKEYPQTKLKTLTASDWKKNHDIGIVNPTSSTHITPRSSGKHVTRTSHLSSADRRRKRRSADKAADREHRYQDIRGTDENFSGRIKNIEQKLKNRPGVQEKKPPDLLRAIGKIESSDWNVREIEKKIMENKLGKNKNNHEKEKVPKWNREQFVARQSKMERKANLERADSLNEKYTEIDKSLKVLDKKLKEGTILEQGQRGNNKVASMAEQFDVKSTDSDSKNQVISKSGSKSAINLPAKGGSEMCHFCGTRVYLMERLSAEGRFFHRGCFRCQYCSINLRLGFYVFDAQHGNKFYCPQHAGMQGKTRNIEKAKNINTKMEKDTLDAKTTAGKGQTPERIEFANLVQSGHVSENEEPPSQMDEDEWTDRNFGQSTAELDSSDLSDSDSDDLYEEALERAGEVQLNTNDNKATRYLGDSPNSDNDNSSDDESSYYDYSSDGDGKDSVTDEEEIILAREMRRLEYDVQERLVLTDTDTTGSDTEVASDEETESSEESRDSATEISTDSEFKLDGATPTMEIPPILLNDAFVTKTRGSYVSPKKIQIKYIKTKESDYAENKKQLKEKDEDIHLEIKPIVPDISTLAPKAPLNQKGGFYFLNRTHSTEGIASKVSLELKKQYLLGSANVSNNIQKSGSASMLDSKLKSFHSNISEHQKLLNPSPSISPTMQTVFNNTPPKIQHTPTLSPTHLKEEPKTDSTSDKYNKLCCLNVQKSDSENDGVSGKFGLAPSDSPNAGLSHQSNPVSSHTDDTVQTIKAVESDNKNNDIQETSIIVPDLPRYNNNRELTTQTSSSFDDVDTDSLSSFDENHSMEKQYHELSHSSSTTNNLTVPKLQINDGSEEPEDMAMDSLLVIQEPEKEANKIPSKNIDMNYTVSWKPLEGPENHRRGSLKSEPKVLNQPKLLDQSPVKLLDIHNLAELSVRKSSSDISLSSTDSNRDITGAALTETELSDWARDENVSDDLDDMKMDADFDTNRKKLKEPKFKNKLLIASAKNPNLDDLNIGHVCGRDSKIDFNTIPTHLADLDSIEFMDTVSEDNNVFDNVTSATNMAMLRNQGYVQFVNVDTHNLQLTSGNSYLKSNNNEDINLTSSARKQLFTKPEKNNSLHRKIDKDGGDDILSNRSNKNSLKMNEECNINAKDSKIKTEENVENSKEYLEHVTRLQNKITEFGNVRDSIDVRKSKGKSKSSLSSSPSSKSDNSPKHKETTPPPPSPKQQLHLSTSEKLKEITKERAKQKDLIHEMVMNKLKAEKKLQSNRKKSIQDSNSADKKVIKKDLPQLSTYTLQKSTTDTELFRNSPTRSNKNKSPAPSGGGLTKSREDLSSHNTIMRKSTSEHTDMLNPRQFEKPQRHSVVFETDVIESNPPTFHRSSSINEHLMFTIKNISTNDSSSSPLFSSEVVPSSSSSKKPNRTKSFSEISREARIGIQKSVSGHGLSDLVRRNRDRNSAYFKSEPCLAEKNNERKPAGEKRKSIIQAVSNFFHKRKEVEPIGKSSRSNSSPGDSSSKERFSLFRISPKSRDKSKKPLSFRKESPTKMSRKSYSPRSRSSSIEKDAPPVPPLPPLEYVLNSSHRTGDESLSETDFQRERAWSSDALDFSETGRLSVDDLDQRKHMRMSQQKRLRIAQEIQRKLEETEVKTRDLESRGVELEKILRGEDSSAVEKKVDESALLAEWLTLMRELAALRRYERELLARAEDLRLEERHSLLQTKLRSSSGSSKGPTEQVSDSAIMDQLLDINEKRESLALILERNHQRYVKEDSDLEALMLAKGLQLTSFKKSPSK